jgi:protein phosphatase
MNATIQLQSVGRTDTGRVRDHNEDSIRIDRAHNLFVVADGVGGNACGEVASAMAVEVISEFIRASAEDAELTWPFKAERADPFESRLETGVRLANRRIREAVALDPAATGMSTTIVACQFVNRQCYFAHVGDSRLYRLRQGELEQLTEDHSLVNAFHKESAGEMDLDLLRARYGNVILRAVGAHEDVQVDVVGLPVEDGDLYLLCSDGLSDMITADTIARLLQDAPNLDRACDALIEAANEEGGRDNISVLLVQAA